MADKTAEVVVPENEPLPIVEGVPTRQRGGARLLHLVLYLITSLIFAFFLVLGGRWVYHKTHHNNQTASNSSSSSSSSNTSKSHAPPAVPGTSSGGSQNKQSAGSTGKSPNTSPSSNSSNGQTAQLPNNGPGNVLGIFLGVSAAAAGLHYAFSSRNYKQRT